MIIFPHNWNKNYGKLYSSPKVDVQVIIDKLMDIMQSLDDAPHLAYSGGIDSTIILAIMVISFERPINTYTISSREDHPDIQFARIGSKHYGSIHHEFIVDPNNTNTDRFEGDNVVRQFFIEVSKYTDRIMCCDGIDEFMCGYYPHQSGSDITYKYYLDSLSSDHLVPLNKNSGDVIVYLPYLDESMIDIYRIIPLPSKVSVDDRKLIIRDMAAQLNVPAEIMNRNKYGMCDAFREKDK